MTWIEIVKAVVTQLDKTIAKYPRKDFIKWMLSKVNLQHRFFSAIIYYRAFRVAKDLQDDYDHPTVVVGAEGSGKSWFAAQLCAVISPTFSMQHICYSLKDFIHIIKTAQPGDSVLLDEGGQFLYSRQAMSESNIVTTKLLMLARQKNLHICICIPAFHSIDTYIRNHRVKTLYFLPRRGQVKMIINKGIKIISKEGSKYQTISNIKLPLETFHTGYTAKKFPEINNLNLDTYKQLKAEHLNEYIQELEQDIKNREPKEPEYIPIVDFIKIVPLSRRTIYNMLQDGRLKAKKIANKWFIHKKETLQSFS